MHQRGFLVCALVSILSIMLSGCFGVVAVYPTECSEDLPITNLVYSKGSFGAWGIAASEQFKKTPQLFFTPTKNEILQSWGQPDETIIVSQSEEIFVYSCKVWCGIVPAFVIPVPLVLPVCEGFDRITFKNDQAIQIHFKKMNGAGLYLGMPLPVPQECPTNKSPPNKSQEKRTK